MKGAMGNPYRVIVICRQIQWSTIFITILCNSWAQDSGLARRLTQPVLQGINKVKKQKSEKRRPTAWNVEHDVSATVLGRRYTVSSPDKTTGDTESDQSSPQSTVNSGRGFRPNELRLECGGRRNSKLLKRSLRNSMHSPYSIWPSAQPLDESGAALKRSGSQRVRRRTIFSPKLETQIESNESTGFWFSIFGLKSCFHRILKWHIKLEVSMMKLK